MKEEHSRTGNEHNAMTEKMENKGGLIHAYLLDGSGGGRRLEMPDIESWRPEQGTTLLIVGDAEIDQTSQGVRAAGDFDTNYILFVGGSVRYTF